MKTQGERQCTCGHCEHQFNAVPEPRHRVTFGDSTVLADVERALGPGVMASMTFTDPPYNKNYIGGEGKRRRKIENDDLGAGFPAFLQDACATIIAMTTGACYICMSPSELATLQDAWRKAGGHFAGFIVWAKDHFTLSGSDYQHQFEPLLYGWREGSKHYWCGDRTQGDVWNIAKPQRSDLHSTMKPVELVERAILNSSKERDIVLDPFGGSGTTMIACERTGRSARLVELDPLYTDTIVRRWMAFAGKDATLEATGQTFNSVAAERVPEVMAQIEAGPTENADEPTGVNA